MIGGTCETCGASPQVIKSGPFAGSPIPFGYCEVCSKDLCPVCLVVGRCRESLDGKHSPVAEEEEPEEARS